VLVLCW